MTSATDTNTSDDRAKRKLIRELAQVIHRKENQIFGDGKTRWSDLAESCQADCEAVAEAAMNHLLKRGWKP